MIAEYHRTVTSQSELDTALADGVSVISVHSGPDEWLSVRHTGFSTVSVRESANVEVWGRANIEASDSATVRAAGNATVKASDNATVKASGDSTVEASDSATVEAWDRATVEASGRADVRAWNFATVSASGSATVSAWDSVTVRAWVFARVRAWNSATVMAWGSTTVEATSRVAVHLHSWRATVTGGTVINHTREPSDPVAWCAWHDVSVNDGKAILYKAVGDDWTTGDVWDYQPVYAPGAELEVPDWRDDFRCGGGLHFSPHTWEALSYHSKSTRFVIVEVDVADLRPIVGSTPKAKAKAPRCRVLHEVDIDGNPVQETDERG